jgi:hypothetical protein
VARTSGDTGWDAHWRRSARHAPQFAMPIGPRRTG